MVDYKLDSNFELERTPWKDFETVDGLEEFEQNVAVSIHFRMRNLLEEPTGNTTKEKIRAQAYRVAEQYDAISQIERIEVQRVLGEKNGYQLTVTYLTGEQFSEVF